MVLNWNGKTMKIMSALIGSVGSVVAAAFFVDDRYAHAIDVKAMHQEQVRAIYENRQETKRAADMLRKQFLEDEVFKITLLPSRARSNIQRALLDRYTRELQEINARWVNSPSAPQGN